MHIEQVALIVDDLDEAIGFFVDVLGFELVEDSPSRTNDGRPKRWVVVRPPGATTALLLARADGERQERAVGDQFAGRVGVFLRVEDFQASYDRMREAGVEFVTEPREEPYGRVAVFLDVAGNRWDLLGPVERAGGPRILGTGVRIDLHPDPETYLGREHRVELAQWHAGEVVFVRLTSFAEFEDEAGTPQRWEGTPQGPYAVPVTRSATSALIQLVRDVDQPLLADFGISGRTVSRFAFHAAPRRIDVDPSVASRLTLD